MEFAKKIFSNRKYFFSNLQTAVIFFQKKHQYLEICYFRSENIFLRIPSPRIPRQVGQGQISRSWYFFKRDIQPRGIRAKVPIFPQHTSSSHRTHPLHIGHELRPGPNTLLHLRTDQLVHCCHFCQVQTCIAIPTYLAKVT